MEREKKFRYLPEVNAPQPADPPPPVVGDSPCPCCGCLTIPNGGDAIAYICPVCLWEIDPFLTGEEEPSDQNHGLTLREARDNVRRCGAVLERLRPYARPPEAGEREAGPTLFP